MGRQTDKQRDTLIRSLLFDIARIQNLSDFGGTNAIIKSAISPLKSFIRTGASMTKPVGTLMGFNRNDSDLNKALQKKGTMLQRAKSMFWGGKTRKHTKKTRGHKIRKTQKHKINRRPKKYTKRSR